MRVTVCGPNLRDQSKGTFHVHHETCGDLRSRLRQEPEYGNGWTIDVDTREEIVRAIYSDHMAEAEQPARWQDYDDLYIFPCCLHNPNMR